MNLIGTVVVVNLTGRVVVCCEFDRVGGCLL